MNFTVQFPSFFFHSQKLASLLLLFLILLMQYILDIDCAPTPIASDNETDRLALLAIKSNFLQDPQAVLSSWNHSSHFCQWVGVTCGHRHRRVTILDLSSSGLVGTLSPYIGNLSFLKVMNLKNNTLEGEIPREVGRLFRLQYLVLNNNSLEGEIPSNISHCFNLMGLYLFHNKLVGKLPKELSSLLKLKILAVHWNNLIGGIPTFLVNLTSLESISFAGNRLGGSIPDAIGLLKNIRRVTLGGNKLSGTIPPSIYNLSSLTILSVGENQLHGSLHPDIGVMLPHLQILDLATNQFTGPLPLSIANCSELELLQMTQNYFTGKVAVNFGYLRKLWRVYLGQNNFGSGERDEMNFISSMANQSSLEELELSSNGLRGVIPNTVGNLSTKIVYLSFSLNHMYGSIPSTIVGLVSLTWLGLARNQFTGTIPSNIGNLQNLRGLALDFNRLSGKIPNSLGNLTVILELFMGANKLEGTISSSLGNCKKLLQLDLFQNNLSGSIPKELFELSALSSTLDLAQNHLSGQLPREIGNLKNLMKLSISENDLSGEIPSSVGSCTSLQYLYLEGNLFQGSIPLSLSSLRGIEELDLSRNNLSGSIPSFFGKFSLNNLNLSYNDFEGEVPMNGVFTNVSAISVVGNTRLCGGVPELHLPKCTAKKTKKRQKMSHPLIIVILIICLLMGISMVSLFLFCWLKKKKKMQLSETVVKESFMKVSYERLLKVTGGFSLENLIGAGGFGSVYKGILDDDGVSVAIKVLNLQNRGASKSFMAECEALRNIRHRNLVNIVTSCSSIDFQGNDFKALVYEFMENGSLEKWLHSNPVILHGQEELHQLGLLQRINIAIDIAYALDYLHHQNGNPIVHCDLKPSNILLDKDMVAHIGDFGLSRFLLRELPNANQSSSIGNIGTIGYVAPEYGLGSEFSANGDVYSYGIVLLEMMTGKSPIDPMFQEGLNLHNYARMALPNRVTEIVEINLLTSDEEHIESTTTNNDHRAEQSNNREKKEECLISIVKIGVACSTESPQDRMDISNVIQELHSIRGILLRT